MDTLILVSVRKQNLLTPDSGGRAALSNKRLFRHLTPPQILHSRGLKSPVSDCRSELLFH